MAYTETELTKMSRDAKFMKERWRGRAEVTKRGIESETDPKEKEKRVAMYKAQLKNVEKYDKLSKK